MADKKTRTQILSENLKRIRHEKNISRKDLARTVGVSEIAIGTYERGLKLPTIENAFSLANALDVQIADLLGDNQNAEGRKIFEFRFNRCKQMAERYLDFMNMDLKPDENGYITVFIPIRLEYKNGVIINSGDDEGNIGNAITFKNAEDFVRVMEQAEDKALYEQIPFYKAFRPIVFKN